VVYSFLITLREGLEAALILGILLAYLGKTRQGRGSHAVWTGAWVAIGLSLAGGLLLHRVADRLSGQALELFEGGMIFLAVGLLSHMLLWMQREARHLKAQLQSAVDERDQGFALGFLAFTVVVREGLETVLFLAGGARAGGPPLTYWGGGLLGLAAAAVLGALLYRGAIRLDLRRFFTLSGWLLILFAAGMVANGVKEFHEANFLPPLIAHVWDTYDLLPDTTLVGRFVGALFGYDPSPSLLQLLGWITYLALAGAAFYRGGRPSRTA
jgi:high-affinity iron transporter